MKFGIGAGNFNRFTFCRGCLILDLKKASSKCYYKNLVETLLSNIPYFGNTLIRGVVMFDINDSLKDIRILKAKLLFLINKRQGNLSDKQVVNAKKILNEALSRYDSCLGEELKKIESSS